MATGPTPRLHTARPLFKGPDSDARGPDQETAAEAAAQAPAGRSAQTRSSDTALKLKPPTLEMISSR